MSKNNQQTLPDYTAKLADVIIAERMYLKKRRAANQITKEEAKETWGLAVSGGGVRSSIISLGFIRELMKKGFFRRFDYISAVSSGSFIPAALSSLLTGNKSPDGKFGVDAENSPFLPKIPEEVKMYKGPNATEQVQHFQRSRGFIPEPNLTGFSVNSLVGVWLGGWAFSSIVFFSVMCFLAAMLLAFMTGVSDNFFIEEFLLNYYDSLSKASIGDRFSLFGKTITEAMSLVWKSMHKLNMPLLGFLFVQGVFFSIFYSEYLRKSIKANSHRSMIIKKARRYMLVGALFICTVILVAGLFRGSSLLQQLEVFPNFEFWIVFVFPASLALGMLVGTHVMSIVYYEMKLGPGNIEELKVAITGVKGANLLILMGAAFLPPFILTMQLIGGYATSLTAFLSFSIGVYWTFYHSRISRNPKGPDGFMFRWGSNFLATIIICFSFASISRFILLFLEEEAMIFMIFGVAFAFNIFLFFFSQANRSNLHNYLKIKIYSAFLITEGRDDKGNLVNLRNDSLIKMQDLGKDNYAAPYLIVNTAVNVHGSSEPIRQERRAYPFIFTKYYCGSEVTNYARTKVYQNGRTKLQDALTNSAAIVHSGMGIYNFWAQSFLITAMNLRLGGWIQNPLYYREKPPGKHINYAFRNLVKEFFGRFNERSRYINVSNGVHTGDNFGLIPLIQRRLSHIVVCDFTGNGQYLSMKNELVQTMALARRYGITDVNLDMQPMKPFTDENGNEIFSECIRVGTFTYKSGKEGSIYYVRAVMTEETPKDLLRYQIENDSFPFEALTKQNFGEEKFDAYLKLGEFLGNQFLTELDEFKYDKLEGLKEIAELLNIRIAQVEKEIGIESWKEPLPDRPDAETLVFNSRLEKLINVVSELVLISSDTPPEKDDGGLQITRKILVEKLGYLRLERAKMAAGSEKFQISKEIEGTERELLSILQQMKGSEDKESKNKLSKLHQALSDLLRDLGDSAEE